MIKMVKLTIKKRKTLSGPRRGKTFYTVNFGRQLFGRYYSLREVRNVVKDFKTLCRSRGWKLQVIRRYR